MFGPPPQGTLFQTDVVNKPRMMAMLDQPSHLDRVRVKPLPNTHNSPTLTATTDTFRPPTTGLPRPKRRGLRRDSKVKHRLLGIRLVFALDTTPCRPPEEQDMDDWCSDADANDRNITDEQAAGILRHVVATNCLRWPAEKNLSLKSSRVLAQFAHANTRPPKRAFLAALHEEWLASRGDVPRRLRLANLSGWANEHLSD